MCREARPRPWERWRVPIVTRMMSAGSPLGSNPVRSDYLAGMLRTLWPEPATIERRGRLTKQDADHHTDYVVLPNDRHPKLVLPRRPWRVASAAVRNYNMYATGSDRLRVLAVAASIRIGAGDLLPAQLRIGDSTGDIVDYLSDALGQRCRVCIYIGPPRAVQKPVLQVLSVAGKTLGFAKLGVDEVSRRLVQRETENLRVLGAAELRTVRVPAVLHSGKWHGHDVLAQQALLRTGRGHVRQDILNTGMSEIAHAGGVITSTLRDSGYWSRLAERIAELPRGPLGDLIQRARDDIESAFGSITLPLGSWHGDFGPWNMTESDGHLLVWDWEHFEPDVPLGFDAVHHQVQSDVLTGSSPQSAFVRALQSAPGLLAPFGMRKLNNDHVVVRLYALDIATRYLTDGEPELDGTTLGRLDWFEPTWRLIRGDVSRVGG